MTASRYTSALLQSLPLAGRVLTSWSCEYNYFVSCADHAALGLPLVPTLNLLSSTDPFFGGVGSGSIADVVSAPGPGAYGTYPPSGSCAAQMRRQGVRGVHH